VNQGNNSKSLSATHTLYIQNSQIITIQPKLHGKSNGTHQVLTRLVEQGTTTKVHNKHTAGQKEYLLHTTDEDKMTPPSGGQRNDDEEMWSRDGTSTGNQGEEDDSNVVDSSNDESVLARPFVIQNNTSTPQTSGTTSNNRFLTTLQSRNRLPTEDDMMTAWNLVQRQQHQEPTQHNDEINGNNGRINATGKRALSYRVAKHLQKKHVNTRIQGLVKQLSSENVSLSQTTKTSTKSWRL
jgi:hypothetical protein